MTFGSISYLFCNPIIIFEILQNDLFKQKKEIKEKEILKYILLKRKRISSGVKINLTQFQDIIFRKLFYYFMQNTMQIFFYKILATFYYFFFQTFQLQRTKMYFPALALLSNFFLSIFYNGKVKIVTKFFM